MAEQYLFARNVRSYEISIWTLQDRFISILKWAMMDQKGQVQQPEIILRDDGTQELSFTVPQYYQHEFERIINPLWSYLDKSPLVANMHKLKVIFNKDSDDEAILEFLVISVTEDHNRDEVNITIKAEGLAFHELGKTGYKVSLNQDNFLETDKVWFESDAENRTKQPLMNLQYWNDLIFKDEDGNWRTNWTYEVHMDWSAFSNNKNGPKPSQQADPNGRYSDILYEDSYVSSWKIVDDALIPDNVEGLKEKERPIEVSESNYYNITQTIAEQFGVFCRYEYLHNDRYEITGRKIIYYNNYSRDVEEHIDLTYPYSASGITRNIDSTELTTKLYVPTVEEDGLNLTIMDVDANRTGEDYILNFDYLKKIGAIDEEQAEAIKDFEYQIHKINTYLKELIGRRDIVLDQLNDAKADVTFYDNAQQEDQEQYSLAEEQYNALVDSEGFVHMEKSFVVMQDTDNGWGWYINISIEGLDPSGLTIYESRSYKNAKDGYGYEGIIPSFQCITDEYNNVTRIQNLARTINLDSDSQVWVIGQYDPRSKYENVMKTWQQRLILDQKKLKEAKEKVATFEFWLNGTPSDELDWSEFDDDAKDEEGNVASGLLIVFEENQEDNTKNPYAAYTVPSRILGLDGEEAQLLGQYNLTTGTNVEHTLVNMLDTDILADIKDIHASPYLNSNIAKFQKEKQKLIDKLNRILGPAMREGYWTPENYNDYGDNYYDKFDIRANDIQYNTPYVKFMWDGKKYYEAEEPIIYEANTKMDMQQHLMIKLSRIFNQNDELVQLQEHIDDYLFFAYPDPVTYETIEKLKMQIRELQGKVASGTDESVLSYTTIKQLNTYWSQQENKFNIDTLEVAQTDNKQLAITIANVITGYMNALIMQDTNIQDYINYNTLNYENIIIQLRTNYPNLTDDQNNSLGLLTVLNNIYTNLSLLASQLNEVKKENPNTLAMTIEAQISKVKALKTIVGQASGWYTYLSTYMEQLKTLEGNKEAVYHTYGIGSSGEFGWVKDTQTDELIPVLIITGVDTLSKDIIEFIETGVYKYTINDTVYYVTTQGATIYGYQGHIITPDSDKIVVIEENPYIGYYKNLKKENSEEENLEEENLEEQNAEEENSIISLNSEKLIDLSYNDFLGEARSNKLDYMVEGQSVNYSAETYRYLRVYPRLFFNTIKLKNTSDKLRLKLNDNLLTINEDYYIVPDDRSEGLYIQGHGYYLTFRTNLMYKNWASQIQVEVVYTLTNADTSIYLDAIQVSKENARPKVSYEVELSILNPEFIHTAYNRLNQIVYINDNDLKLEEVSGYISSVTLKLDKPWEDTVEIKNYQTKFEDLFSTIVAQTEALKKSEMGLSTAINAFTTTGFIDSDVLQDSILKADLNLEFNKGTLTISQSEGIWGVSDSGVVAFRGGGIFTSNRRDADGNRIWNTGILPSGINANLITAGQLDTNRIKVYAGDELRFQLNGEGFYAYKQNTTEGARTNIDYKQYVVYNPEGLFLIAKTGTTPVHYDEDNNPQYDPAITQDVKRVEVSWDGFILRNWQNEKVFYADPTTGNLTLAGTIKASEGEIGGWVVETSRLMGSGIKLVSKASTGEAAGIYLTNEDSFRQKVVYDRNNNKYYAYQTIVNNVTYNYFLSEDFISRQENTNIITLTLAENADDLYEEELYIASAVPIYQKLVTVYATNDQSQGSYDANSDLSLQNTTDVTTVSSKIYIMTDGTGEHYFDINGNHLEYIPSENIEDEGSWFDQLTTACNNAVPAINYTSFISVTTNSNYVKVASNAWPNNANTLTLTRVGDKGITFKVEADSGESMLLQGRIGNFNFDDANGFSNGSIANTVIKNNNIFEDNEYNFGQLFCDISANSEQGVFTLKRVNNTTVNFNIASMRAYQAAVEAAGNLTLNISQNGFSEIT